MLQKVSPEPREEPAMREVLDGRRQGLAGLMPFAGPAVVVSVAYIDPGNFATNIQAGARYGYGLLWVVVLANLVAMLFQSLSARLGIATGRNLAELCREHLPRPLVYLMWVVSELAAMATDLAEFLGGAIGLALLFDLPLLVGMGITAVVTYALLLLEGKGYRRLELAIGALVGVVGLSYLAELFIAPIGWKSLGQQIFVPNLPDSAALAIAVGIIGATVMPHALFLHSGLTERRARPKTTDERRRIIRLSNLEVVLALSVAGLINLAMVIMAAGAFHGSHPDVAKIETAYQTLVPLLGGAAATIFLVSLIASGFSSSVVGTMAGQMIMQGFVAFRIPLWLRRSITMLPSFAVVVAGVDATHALVMSQVALSIALPFPMVALVWFTSRSDLMGPFRNRVPVTVAAVVAALVVLALNVVLLLDAFGMVSL
ncbi:Nramp family divalent metal transporter [Luteibacter jiangsuensis]|uniref:Divalent metal cation transporter MntH n=1 Tax=Luteibacter jiangsuensis TaxID=637577 RepID=A0ABX0Q6X9_9GAMM|nr:Nramp family divalent metal transporter [Luteibacter jiangsuensis]NID06123.1 Nramp family divalent metal transporter [Luteibacter jiangsuensis]